MNKKETGKDKKKLKEDENINFQTEFPVYVQRSRFKRYIVGTATVKEWDGKRNVHWRITCNINPRFLPKKEK